MSRRLDISSLLCDEPPEDHVVLAPIHPSSSSSSSSPSSRAPSQAPQSRTSAHSVHYDQHPQQPSPRPSSSHQPLQSFVGLEALVHAATQERRRLSGSDLVQPQPQQPPIHQPLQFSQHQLHQQYQRQSPQYHRSPWQEDLPYPPRQPQSPLHPKSIDELSLRSPRDTFKAPTSPYHQSRHHPYEDERVLQMRQFQLQQQERERDRERAHRAQELELHQRLQLQQEADRIRALEADRLAEIERKAHIERTKMEEERLKLEAERMRLLEVERRLQEQEQRRHDEQRREVERQRQEEERREAGRREREIAAIREAERRELQRRDRDRDIDIQRRQEEQRHYDAQELQRNEDIQRRLHLQQRQYTLHQQQQQQQQQQQHMQIQHQQGHRVYEHPPRIEIPPGPQLANARKSDPIPIMRAAQSQSPIIQPHSHMPPDHRPAKKRRYSESPSLLPMHVDDNLDRIQRERERMSVGEIGYGRFEIPAAGPSSSSLPSYTSLSSPLSALSQPLAARHPTSGTGARKPVSVNDLLSSDHDVPASIPTSPSMSVHSPRMVVIPPREASSPVVRVPGAPSFPPSHQSAHHRILSPLGRRSPPGSQIGRAKASRKAEDQPHSIVHSGSLSSASSPSVPSLPNPVIAVPNVHRSPPLSTQLLLISTVPDVPTTFAQTLQGDIQQRQPTAIKKQKPDELLPTPTAPGSVHQVRKKTPAVAVKDKELVDHSHHQRPPKQSPQLPMSDKVVKRDEEGDAHDWLLEHYAQPSPLKQEREAQAHPCPPSLARTRSPLSSVGQKTVKSPVGPAPVRKQPTPVAAGGHHEDEDDGGLDQELEQLLAEVKVPAAKEDPDAMDVDLDVDSAVAELVAETLEEVIEPTVGVTTKGRQQWAGKEEEEEEAVDEADSVKYAVTTEQVTSNMVDDVEDELLSLVEDKLPASGPSAFGKNVFQAPVVSVGKAGKVVPKPARKPTKPAKVVPPPLKTSGITTSEAATPLLPSATSSTSPASASLTRPVSARPPTSASERESMPPPNSATVSKDAAVKKKHKAKGSEKDTAVDVQPSSSANAKKKSTKQKSKGNLAGATADEDTNGASLPPSTVQKPRAKPTKVKKPSEELEVDRATPTVLPAVDSSTKLTATTAKPPGVINKSLSRSRSTSAMPGVIGDDSTSPGESEGASEDDKLYCVCKTKYDQERFMIACDRCDEWYHMQCVDMPESVADLVDQFFCPPCIEKNPGLHLITTYKARCLWGLKHPDPDSIEACHKPARGAFSKYCSEECGVKYMQSRIDSWAKKGGKKDKLWESVKHAEKLEGVVVKIEEPVQYLNGKAFLAPKGDNDGDTPPSLSTALSHLKPSKPAKSKTARDKDRLIAVLDGITKMRDELKRGIDILAWRERLLTLAVERSETVAQCGWDQRLCFGDEDWAEQFGQNIAESYESLDKADRMEVDGSEGQWWCSGDTVCARHLGWQTTRFKDITKDKEKREEALSKLEIREQEVRQQLDEMANPPPPGQNQRRQSNAKGPGHGNTNKTSHKPLSSSHPKPPNGHSKLKAAPGETVKKGKKRKAP